MSLAYLPREAGNSSLMEVGDHVPLRLLKMRDLKSLMHSWCSFSWWGWERVTYSFAFIGGQYLRHDYLQPTAMQITQDARPKIVDTGLTLISMMGQGVCLFIFWSERRPVLPKEHWHTLINMLRLAAGYHNATINWTTHNAEQEIGPDRSTQSRRNPHVFGHGSGFGPPRNRVSGFGRVWNQTHLFFRSKPRLLVGFPDPLLTLTTLQIQCE